jgi:hypothetical protein
MKKAGELLSLSFSSSSLGGKRRREREQRSRSSSSSSSVFSFSFSLSEDHRPQGPRGVVAVARELLLPVFVVDVDVEAGVFLAAGSEKRGVVGIEGRFGRGECSDGDGGGCFALLAFAAAPSFAAAASSSSNRDHGRGRLALHLGLPVGALRCLHICEVAVAFFLVSTEKER